MSFPPLNHPLLLFKYIKELALPCMSSGRCLRLAQAHAKRHAVDVYPVIDRLAPLISYNFSFPTSGNRYRISSLPEPQLISLLIVAVKLYYPFDSITRYPRTSSEPAALNIDWKAWAATQEEHVARIQVGRELKKGKEMEIGEHDVFDMSGGQIDEYLDWYEKTWIDEEARKSYPRALPEQLLEMFPTNRPEGPTGPQEHALGEEDESRVDEGAILDKIKQVQRAMRMRRVVSDEDAEDSKEPIRRPGSYYKHYRRVEDLPHDARVFFDAAARVVGLSLRTLTKAVFQTESKLQAWKLAQRKTEAANLMQDHDQALSTDGSEPPTLQILGGDNEQE